MSNIKATWSSNLATWHSKISDPQHQWVCRTSVYSQHSTSTKLAALRTSTSFSIHIPSYSTITVYRVFFPLIRYKHRQLQLHTNLTEPKVDRLFIKHEVRKVLVTDFWHSAMPPATVITKVVWDRQGHNLTYNMQGTLWKI